MEDTMKLFTQNQCSNAGQATVNGFFNNLSPDKLNVEELNRTMSSSRAVAGTGLEDAPFYAVRPDVAGRRNSVRAAEDAEPITLSRVQEIGPRQHPHGRPLLGTRKK
jgi:hypothetical protein